VGRYANEPTILGWELANEPRCRGSTRYVITGSVDAMKGLTVTIIIAHLRALAHLPLSPHGRKRFLPTSNLLTQTISSLLETRGSSISLAPRCIHTSRSRSGPLLSRTLFDCIFHSLGAERALILMRTSRSQPWISALPT
jgi:hypothetical protein